GAAGLGASPPRLAHPPRGRVLAAPPPNRVQHESHALVERPGSVLDPRSALLLARDAKLVEMARPVLGERTDGGIGVANQVAVHTPHVLIAVPAEREAQGDGRLIGGPPPPLAQSIEDEFEFAGVEFSFR